jgi:hypothetical protein
VRAKRDSEYHLTHLSRTLDAGPGVREYRCTSPQESGSDATTPPTPKEKALPPLVNQGIRAEHLMTTLWIVLGVWVVCSVPVALILARLFRRPRPGRPGRIGSPEGGSPGGGVYPLAEPESDPGSVESHQRDDEFAPRRRRDEI